jgi:DNA-binding beta-propeller fold protein YncE
MVVCCAIASVPSLVRADAGPDYKLYKAVPLGAPDRWDYVTYDAASHRVFVAHGDRVTVVDGATGDKIGDVLGLSGGTHGIGISTANGRGYTDDGHAGMAGSFDLATLKPEARIKADDDADAITVDPLSGNVFVVDSDPGKITVIDPKLDKPVATIDVGGGLESAVADGTGHVYVNGAERSELVRIDTKSNRVDARWPIPDCKRPHGLAFDGVARRLFVSCVNAVAVVVDADSGHQVGKLPIGNGTDSAAFDPKRKLFFSSNGRDGTISVIAEQGQDKYAVVATVKTAITARTMAIDPVSGRLYLAAADIDPHASTGNGRPEPLPGSLKLLILDPAS